MNRVKPTAQHYEAYTAEDFDVWRTLFERQMELLKLHACDLYLEALPTIGFTADAIPDFQKTSERLIPLTGWQMTVVPELVPQQEFFDQLSRRVFPATCWLRTRAELNYIEEPDMFHDVFGHVPLLSNPAYATFMVGIGKLALQWLHNPQAIELLGRIYWFTVEFGLIRQGSDFKVYGAGIISSPEETRHSMSGVPIHDFNIEHILQTPYRTDTLQEGYFAIHSFEELYNALPAIERALPKFLETVPVEA